MQPTHKNSFIFQKNKSLIFNILCIYFLLTACFVCGTLSIWIGQIKHYPIDFLHIIFIEKIMSKASNIKQSATNEKVCDTEQTANNKSSDVPVSKTPIDKRYELAYMKIHSALPAWKRNSFNKENKAKNDTLYDEFIRDVIRLAEDESQEILLTA